MTQRMVDDAAAQLRRLLIAIPTLADDSPHRIADVAAEVGVSEQVLMRDLRTLVTRFDDEPGGFTAGVRLAFGSDTVQLESTLFRRPMGLTPSELGALELGLAALEQELPPHEAAVATRARGRVAEAATGIAPDADGASPYAARLVGTGRDAGHLSVARSAIAARRKAKLTYRSGGAVTGSERTVHPYGVVYARGHWYLIAHCDVASSLRIFRLDRILAVEVLDEPAVIPSDLDIEATLHDGRAIIGHSEETMRVRYSAKIARWIAEHGKVEEQPDGSVIVEHSLLDDEWAVRHVLQYGPEAKVLGPARMRTLIADRLEAVLASG